MAQLVFLNIRNPGIEVTVLYLAGKTDNIMRSGGKIADEQGGGNHREQDADQADRNDHVTQAAVRARQLLRLNRTEHSEAALTVRQLRNQHAVHFLAVPIAAFNLLGMRVLLAVKLAGAVEQHIVVRREHKDIAFKIILVISHALPDLLSVIEDKQLPDIAQRQIVIDRNPD
ncbi:hypothetical protein D3C73_1148160 [compost metagenome]